MATDFQARVASEVLWREGEMLRYRYFDEGYEHGSPSQTRSMVGSLLGPKSKEALGLGWSEVKAKTAFTSHCYLAMRMALEAAEKAAEWEAETKNFKQELSIIDRSPAHLARDGLGEFYVEAIIDPSGRRRLIGPFDRRSKAEEWIKAFGRDRLTPELAEFVLDALKDSSCR